MIPHELLWMVKTKFSEKRDSKYSKSSFGSVGGKWNWSKQRFYSMLEKWINVKRCGMKCCLSMLRDFRRSKIFRVCDAGQRFLGVFRFQNRCRQWLKINSSHFVKEMFKAFWFDKAYYRNLQNHWMSCLMTSSSTPTCDQYAYQRES